MIKKAYITPGTEVQTVEIQNLLVPSITTTGGDKITGDPNPDNSQPGDTDYEDNRSRKTYNCWDDEDEELDY